MATQTSAIFAANSNYAAPTVALYTGPGADDAATTGSQLVRIDGRNFGPKSEEATSIDKVEYFEDRVQADGKPVPTPRFQAQGCIIAADHVVVECKTAPGAGKDLRWVVTIRGQESKAATTNYAPPTITSITGPGSKNAATEGGQEVVIAGTNFGPPPDPAIVIPGGRFLQKVTYGWEGTEYSAQKCKVTSHEEIRCETAPGVGTGHQWFVTVKGQLSPPTGSRTNYAIPAIVSWGQAGTNFETVKSGPSTSTETMGRRSSASDANVNLFSALPAGVSLK